MAPTIDAPTAFKSHSRIADPPEGQRFKYRGLVRFEWRERRRVGGRKRQVVVRRARRVTRGGLKGVPGGRPRGRSDAVCVVEGPTAPDVS